MGESWTSVYVAQGIDTRYIGFQAIIYSYVTRPVCFDAWRVYGAQDPSDWANFEGNLVAETVAGSFAGDPPFEYFLVTAAGTDGVPGPTGH